MSPQHIEGMTDNLGMVTPTLRPLMNTMPLLASAPSSNFVEQEMLRFVASQFGRPKYDESIDPYSPDSARLVIGVLQRHVDSMDIPRLSKMFDYFNDFSDSLGGGFYGLIGAPEPLTNELTTLRLHLCRRLLKDRQQGLDPNSHKEAFHRLCIRAACKPRNIEIPIFSERDDKFPEYIYTAFIREIELIEKELSQKSQV